MNTSTVLRAQKTLLTASKVTPLLELLYVLLVVRVQGAPTEDAKLEVSRLAKEVLPTWGPAIPNLRDTCLALLRNKGADEALQSLGGTLRQLAGQGKGDTEVPLGDIEALATLGQYFKTNSEVALSKLRRIASISKSPWVVQNLAPKVGDQHSTKDALAHLVKSLVGREDSALTVDEAKQLKETNPESYKAYLLLRREFNQAWKDALVSFIRKSGTDKVPYTKAIEYLHLNGIEHLMPTGFTGLIDDMSRLYTAKGEPVEGVPNAVTFPSVIMNDSYGKPDGGDWVFMAQRTDGTAGPYFYTSSFKQKQAVKKFAKVDALTTKMPTMRKKWFARVRQFDPTKPECITALVLEILFEFSARIGSLGNAAAGQPTYGVATLQVRHAVIDPTGNIVLRYKGKDGVATVHKLMKADPEQKFVIAALNQLLADKEPKERIFTYTKGSKSLPISPAQVNMFFKACGAPPDTTVHKIRTYQGTKLFKELMEQQAEKPRQPKTEHDAMMIFKAMAEAVGKKLNHVRRGQSGTKVTGTTALNAYIDVSAQILFWERLNMRVPKYLEKYSQHVVA